MRLFFVLVHNFNGVYWLELVIDVRLASRMSSQYFAARVWQYIDKVVLVVGFLFTYIHKYHFHFLPLSIYLFSIFCLFFVYFFCNHVVIIQSLHFNRARSVPFI